MIVTIHRSELLGDIVICPSKSYEQRIWAMASTPESEIKIFNQGTSDDANACRGIAQKLSEQNRHDNIFDCGESALCARMYPSIMALHTDSFSIKPSGSLIRRNIGHDLDFFSSQLGWEISSNGQHINISNAHLYAGKYTIDGSHTSQVITGLVFALSTLSSNSELRIEKPSSIGYIILSIKMARQAGANISYAQTDDSLIINIEGNTRYKASFTVEGDWSNAAFLIAAGLTNGGIRITGLNPDSMQPDKAIIDILHLCKANFEWKNNVLSAHKSDIQAFEFNAHNTPDLIPPLCILALNANGECKIYGANRLVGKESNRLEAIVTELRKLGANISTDGNCIITHPLKSITPALLDSHDDHRIAMMLAILGLSFDGIKITNCECVNKSYPQFYDTLKNLGGKIEFE